MNTPLNTFPAPLLRPILCGRKGLAPAWGPLTQGDDVWAWNPTLGRVASPDRHAYPYGGRDPLASPEAWFLPLDDNSPWPARLAVVAAWMLTNFVPLTPDLIPQAAMVRQYDSSRVHLEALRIESSFRALWKPDGTASYGPDLFTLPQHLQTHPPAVALLLALYDVPDIRTRVESA